MPHRVCFECVIYKKKRRTKCAKQWSETNLHGAWLRGFAHLVSLTTGLPHSALLEKVFLHRQYPALSVNRFAISSRRSPSHSSFPSLSLAPGQTLRPSPSSPLSLPPSVSTAPPTRPPPSRSPTPPSPPARRGGAGPGAPPRPAASQPRRRVAQRARRRPYGVAPAHIVHPPTSTSTGADPPSSRARNASTRDAKSSRRGRSAR